MSLVILEGLDKTGKSTVAEYFRQKQKHEYIHMTAPAKWHTPESYYAEMMHLIASTVGKNVVIDRSWFGELVWPNVFSRKELLTARACVDLTSMAKMAHGGNIQLILMHDPDEAAHLERISQFKEPSYDFALARRIYDEFDQYGFTKMTFKEAETKGWI